MSKAGKGTRPAEKSAPEPSGPPDKRAIKEARRMLKETAALLKKHGKRLSAEDRARVEEAMKGVEEACDPSRGGEKRLSSAIKTLDEVVDQTLGFAKKSGSREFIESIAVAILIAAVLRAFVIEAFKIPSGSMIPTLEVGDHIFVNKFIYGLRIPFTNAWLWERSGPERGDVIVFRYPLDPSKDYIKRVVAIAGDRVRVDGREVFVNDKKLEREQGRDYEYWEDAEPGSDSYFPSVRQADAFPEKSLSEPPKSYTVLYSAEDLIRPAFPSAHELSGLDCTKGPPGQRGECRIMDGYVFVMGDNRDNSSDSRAWGGVARNLVKGKAMFVWWSRGEKAGVRWTRMGKLIE